MHINLAWKGFHSRVSTSANSLKLNVARAASASIANRIKSLNDYTNKFLSRFLILQHSNFICTLCNVLK